MSKGDDDMVLVLAFDSDSEDFTRGFEAGGLWARMHTEDHVDQVMHATNAEMAMRMCEALGFSFMASDINDMWTRIEMHR